MLTANAFADPSIVRYDAVEQWRTVDDESAPYLFGVVSQAATDSKGRVYLLDRQLQELHRFTADGAYDRIICRSGGGPGELSMTFWFTITPEDRIALPRSFPPGVVFVDTDGTYLDSISYEDADGQPAFNIAIGELAVSSTGMLVEGQNVDFSKPGGEETRILAHFTPDGRLQTEIVRHVQSRIDFEAARQTIDERARWFAGSRRALAPDGRIFVALDRDAYAITVLNPDGSVSQVIERDVSARRRSAEEIQEAEKNYGFSRSDGRPMPEFEFVIAETAPPIGTLRIQGDVLWVRLDAPDLPDDCQGRYAVHALDGTYLETREIYIPYDRDTDFVRPLADGRFVVLENYTSASRAASGGASIKRGNEVVEEAEDDEFAPMNVIVYEMKRR